jgi:hypothetical protein
MKNAVLAVVLAFAFLFTSCGAYVAAPATGFLYTDLKAPIMATSNPVATKVGTAEVTSILGIVATGDASIAAAARNGGITRISHIDYEAKSILGIFAKYTVYVYGE